MEYSKVKSKGFSRFIEILERTRLSHALTYPPCYREWWQQKRKIHSKYCRDFPIPHEVGSIIGLVAVRSIMDRINDVR